MDTDIDTRAGRVNPAEKEKTMRIQMVIHNPHRKVVTVTKYANTTREINEVVNDTLSKHGIDEETAIDCASWCELATDCESYNEENFDVYLEEI